MSDINKSCLVTSSKFKELCWSYYLTIEKDVLKVEPYVSFHPENQYCFSNEFIKLYQTICSEIDSLCKEYCKYLEKEPQGKEKYDILFYGKNILEKHPEMIKQVVCISGYQEWELIPWEKWDKVTPEWWKKYNSIKHERFNLDKINSNKYNYQHANLKNVLNSLAALYILEYYFYYDLTASEFPPGKIIKITMESESKLFRTLFNTLI